MSKTIAFTEAKAHLSSLVDRVARGEEFLITRHDQVAARLGPAHVRSINEIRETVDEMRALARGKKATIKEIIAWKNEGRP
ncbi:MAG TPA: type II toxin-antitoxin system prevent-host-death family antitoxin [Tepidisphaeraceae bacterium]